MVIAQLLISVTKPPDSGVITLRVSSHQTPFPSLDEVVREFLVHPLREINDCCPETCGKMPQFFASRGKNLGKDFCSPLFFAPRAFLER